MSDAMKRRDIIVRVVRNPKRFAGLDVIDVATERPVPEIPIEYAETFRAAKPGDQFEASIFSDPPCIDPTTGEAWREPVSFHIVDRAVAASTAK